MPKEPKLKRIHSSKLGIITDHTILCISPELREVFRTLTIFNDIIAHFHYKTIITLISTYITKNWHKLFKGSDRSVIYCDTLLKAAFKVNSTPTSKFGSLLRANLKWPEYHNNPNIPNPHYEIDPIIPPHIYNPAQRRLLNHISQRLARIEIEHPD